jgi:hypothetical protein
MVPIHPPSFAGTARHRCIAFILLAAALLPAGFLRADTIILKTDGGTAQVDGTVESVDAAEVVYIPLATDRRSRTPIASVLQIKAPGEPELTAAEQAFADGRWAEAVAKYPRVMSFSTSDWAKYRATVRLIEAAGKCQQFEPRVTAFVELAKFDPANARAHSPAITGLKVEQIDAAIGDVDRVANSPDLKKESAGVLKEFRGSTIASPAPGWPVSLSADWLRRNASGCGNRCRPPPGNSCSAPDRGVRCSAGSGPDTA